MNRAAEVVLSGVKHLMYKDTRLTRNGFLLISILIDKVLIACSKILLTFDGTE